MGLPILGLVLSAGTSFLQASMGAQAADNAAKVQNEQIKIDMANERIKGMQEGSKRHEEYLRNESANRVASAAATGGGTNMSYEQGIAPYNKGVAGRDMATMAFNTGQKIGRMKYEIKVNRYNAQAQARAGYIGAVGDTAGAIGSYLQRPGGLLA